jgi:hypothetical protein
MGRMLSRNINVNTDLLLYKGITLKGFGMRGWLAAKTTRHLQEASQDLIRMMQDPSFHLPKVVEFSLENFKEAFGLNEQPGKPGKVIFRFA